MKTMPFLLRLPPDKHAALKAKAAAEGVSINTYILRKLGLEPNGAADHRIKKVDMMPG